MARGSEGWRSKAHFQAEGEIVNLCESWERSTAYNGRRHRTRVCLIARSSTPDNLCARARAWRRRLASAISR
eukprot:1575-Pleurochrysis_carterae.AAC.3